MFKTTSLLILILCLAGCGLPPDVIKSDGFNNAMKSTKRAGILVSRFSLVSKDYKVIDAPLANKISDKVSEAMGRHLKENATILPFETVLLPNVDVIRTRLAPNLNALYIPTTWKIGEPEKAVGVNGMFGNLDDYFKNNDIDMLLVLSGDYTITTESKNGVASFIGALAAGVLAGADFTKLGALAGGPNVRPEMFCALMGIDRSGTVKFTAMQGAKDKFSANMLSRYGIEKAAKEVMEKVKKEM